MTQETKYPEAARKLQEAIFDGLPEAERADWQAAFSEKAETVIDWQMVIDKTVLASLRIAEPHDTSTGKVVAAVIALYERKLIGDNLSDAEWNAADDAANAAAWLSATAAEAAAADAAGAASWFATDGAAWTAEWAATAATHAAEASAAWVQIRDEFLNA